MRTLRNTMLAASLMALPIFAGGQQVFSASGADKAAIQGAVDLFRLELGSPNNGGTPGTQPAGRREINWDGRFGPAAPVNMPFDLFKARGNLYFTPGSGFQISGANGDLASTGPEENFGNIDPTYANAFQPFSNEKLFTPTGSNVLDVIFTVPGSADAGGSRAFGAVFSDVDLANATSIQFFDFNGGSLGEFFAPASAGDGDFSFLGVSFENSLIHRARITAGNAALGAGVLDGGAIDLVVMDDFLFAEPQAVPEPGALALLASGATLLLGFRRRARR